MNTGELLVTLPDDTQVVAASGTACNSGKTVIWHFCGWIRQDLTESTDGESCLVADTRPRTPLMQLEVYEDVWMYGGDTSGQPVYAFVVEPWIYVEDFTQYMLLLQGLPEPGMSGGGAFTEDGVFLGILCGADEEGKVAVVPYSIIESERAGLDNP